MTTDREAISVIDLVAELMEDFENTGLLDRARQSDQVMRHLGPLLDHPDYIKAVKRKRQRFHDHLKRCADRVEEWPQWMKGRGIS